MLGVVAESPQNKAYLIAGVGIVTNVDDITKPWRVNLFIFRCNQETSDSNRLEVLACHLPLLKVSVNQVNGKVKSPRDEFKLHVHFYKPINENSTHTFIMWG